MKPITVFSLFLFFALSTVRAAEPKRFEYDEKHMGTTFRIVLYAPDADANRAEELLAQMTTFLDEAGVNPKK